MKFIFSFLSDTYYNFPVDIEMAKISNFLIQEKGFETIFFGDKTSIEYFKSVSFTHVNEIKEEEIIDIPKCLWSMSKLISFTKMNEPFLHIDFDVFLFKFQDSLFNNNILCLNSEYSHDNMVKTLQEVIKIRPVKTLKYEEHSYNCGIIGGNNFSILKKVAEELLEYIKLNKNLIDKAYIVNCDLNFIKSIPMLVEQVWMFQLYKYYNEKFNFYIDFDLGEKENFNHDFFKKGVIHFQHSKFQYEVQKSFADFTKHLNITV